MNRLALILICILMPARMWALDPPHDASNSMDCPRCHTDHPSAAASLSTDQGKLNLCTSCHNPAGATDSSVHRHPGSPDTICTTCHDPHNQAQTANGSTYGKYVKTSIETPNSGTRTVIFKGPTGKNSFADGDSTYDGICEVCHTTTKYHRNDSSGDHTHHAGEDCTTCHTHQNGFRFNLNNCTDCHNSPQGAGGYRRQVVAGPLGAGDFGLRSHHVGTGAQSVTNSDCQVCHDQTLHQSLWDGVSTLLKNPDGGLSYMFDGTGASVEGFCIGCHDGNAMAGRMKPFSDGRTPTDIAFSGIYATSLHNNSGLGCYGTGSAGSGCHANGHGSQKKFHLAPENIAANTTNFSEEEEGFCDNCHSPIASELTKTRNHMMTSSTMAGKHAIGEALVPATYSGTNRHVECTDCHNQHWIQAGTKHTVGTNAASEVLKYVSRIQATYGATANVAPTFTPRTARDTTPAKEYELCFKCHSSWAFGSTPPTTPEGTVETDQSVEFNPNNKSFHPVTGLISTNSYTIPTATNHNIQTMNAPWNTSTHKLMYCSDCHDSENTASPKGPHGSANNYLLINSDPDKGLCLVCHKASVYNPATDPGTAETGSRFDQQTTGVAGASHYLHVTGRGFTCARCHGSVKVLPTGTTTAASVPGASHGTNTVPGLMNGTSIRAYSPGSCSATCHGSIKTYTGGPE